MFGFSSFSSVENFVIASVDVFHSRDMRGQRTQDHSNNHYESDRYRNVPAAYYMRYHRVDSAGVKYERGQRGSCYDCRKKAVECGTPDIRRDYVAGRSSDLLLGVDDKAL